jgi:hypothetical protein
MNIRIEESRKNKVKVIPLQPLTPQEIDVLTIFSKQLAKVIPLCEITTHTYTALMQSYTPDSQSKTIHFIPSKVNLKKCGTSASRTVSLSLASSKMTVRAVRTSIAQDWKT